MHHHNKDIMFAELSDKELNKIVETEKFLNSQQDHSNRSEEIILLAYKQQQSG
jgi:hypothetical protein